MGAEAVKQSIQKTRAVDQAELAQATKIENFVRPGWTEISGRLGFRGNVEQIKKELLEAADKGRLELSAEFVWGINEYEHPKFRDLVDLTEPHGYRHDDESRQMIRDLYREKLSQWFRQNVSDDLTVDIDNNSGNIILTWTVPKAAR